MKMFKLFLVLGVLLAFSASNSFAGYALEFDGVDDPRFAVLDAAGLDGVTECTVEYWVYIDQQNEDRFATVFSGFGELGNDNEYTHFYWYPNSPENSGLTPYIKSTPFDPGAAYNLNEWFHAAVVRQANGDIELYINGQLAEVDNMPGGTLEIGSLYIGIDQDQLNGDFDEPLNGAIDELRVWDVARTAQEIADNFESSITVPTAGLVAYYNFDEGTGQTVTDITGNGHDGYLGDDPGPDNFDPIWIDSDLPEGQQIEQDSHLFYPGWTLMSVPLEPNSPKSPDNVIGDDIPGIWDFYQFYYSTGYFRPDSVYTGPGYWLAIAHDTTWVEVEGLENTESFEWELEDNWNIIGDPFNASANLEDALFHYDGGTYTLTEAADSSLIVPVLWGCTPQLGYFSTTTFEPWFGYWLLVLEEGITMELPVAALNLNNGDGELDDERSDDINAANWIVNITAEQNAIYDRALYIGANANASNGYDHHFDFPAPPSPPDEAIVRTLITRPNWIPELEETGFSYDIRNVLPIGTSVYDFKVVSNMEEDVTLSWNSIEFTTPEGFQFVLENLSNGDVVDMNSESSYTFNAGIDQYEFEVRVIADVTSVEDQNNAVASEFALLTAYPNPFNPSTSIHFTLPQAGTVEIAVYDVMGREVASLLNGVRSAGEHTIGFGDSDLTSGVYFVRMTTNGQTLSQKLMLLK
ncbi:T9SS type A sorting domain-containing protein [bacterium]|nr:T9SS type A sorting domain-containing protein [bacterium]